MRCPALVLAILVLSALAPLAEAHGGGAALPGDTLARARLLGPPPARAFEELEAGEPHYYRVSSTESARLRVVAPAGSAPGLVVAYVFGEGLPNGTLVPSDIERPEGWGALVFGASEGQERVDARLPQRQLLLVDAAIGAGERVVVVRAESTARVALLLEEPGLAWQDLALLPSVRSDARAWAATPAWATWLAGGAAAVVVLAYLLRWRGSTWPLASLLGGFAAMTFAASTALLALDAVRARHAPWILVAVGAALVAGSLWSSRPRGAPGIAVRAALLACGLVGLVSWSGFLWGPVAALAGALLPEPEARDPAR